MFVVEGMVPKDIIRLKEEIEQVAHVEKVIWYDSVMDISVPMEMMPDAVYEAFNSGDATMMAIIFGETTSADGTMEAIEEIRKVADKNCFLSGMSAVVTDTKNLSEREAPIYVCIAVLLSCLVLSLTMDSFLIPFLFLLSIGMAIVYNLGSNVFMGEISYITKALSAVLQLGVTMDYSVSKGSDGKGDWRDNHFRGKQFHDYRGRVHRLVLYELYPWHGFRYRYGKGRGIRRDRMCDGSPVLDSGV